MCKSYLLKSNLLYTGHSFWVYCCAVLSAVSRFCTGLPSPTSFTSNRNWQYLVQQHMHSAIFKDKIQL